MDQTPTFEDLLLFAFNESSMAKTAQILREIETNPKVACWFTEIQSLLGAIPEAEFEPEEKIVSQLIGKI